MSQPSTADNMMITDKDSKNEGLKVLIAGAGIGGLAAALALRQQGHRVTLYERSKFARETGAAIHSAPNCTSLLDRLGLDLAEIGGNETLGLDVYQFNGKHLSSTDFAGPLSAMWQRKWYLVHRARLHSTLKRMALQNEGSGSPAELLTSKRVVDVDCASATIVLEGGERIKGDLVLGADGVHSALRKAVSGQDHGPFGSGKSAFRFLIPRAALQADPDAKRFVMDGRMCMQIGRDRRIVTYPCDDNTNINCLVIHPSSESDTSANDWEQSTSMSNLQEVCKGCGPEARALISHADPASLAVWELLDMDVLSRWTNGRAALLGDAAHPFLPHQGQGGAQAVEDAVSIAALLPQGVPKAEIQERLELYQECRMARANRIQQYTRIAGQDAGPQSKPLDMMEYTIYNFQHDEWDHSTHELNKWLWSRKPSLYWRMPTCFGPMPGPRQDHSGRKHRAHQSTFRTSSIRFKTSRTYLQTLFPTPAFTFASPGTVVEATISNSRLDKMEWLGGRGYNHCGLYIHGVKYTREDATELFGSFLAVLFEDLADPITSGREELGFPKLSCTIDEEYSGQQNKVGLSSNGFTFASLHWPALKRVHAAAIAGSRTKTEFQAPAPGRGPPPPPPDDGLLTWRCIPSVGDRGLAERCKPDAEYTVWTPREDMSKESIVNTTLESESASISFHKGDWTVLPTLHHVAAGMTRIPIYGIVEAKVVEGSGVPDNAHARRAG